MNASWPDFVYPYERVLDEAQHRRRVVPFVGRSHELSDVVSRYRGLPRRVRRRSNCRVSRTTLEHIHVCGLWS